MSQENYGIHPKLCCYCRAPITEQAGYTDNKQSWMCQKCGSINQLPLNGKYGTKTMSYCTEKGWSYRLFDEKWEDATSSRVLLHPHRILIATPVSVWKIVPREDPEGFLLLHHNYLKGLDVLMHPDVFSTTGNFYHRQRDKQEFTNITSVLDYIERHDKIRKLENQGLDKMPTTTKRQRLWKRHAKNRQNKQAIKRVYSLLNELEKQYSAT